MKSTPSMKVTIESQLHVAGDVMSLINAAALLFTVIRKRGADPQAAREEGADAQPTTYTITADELEPVTRLAESKAVKEFMSMGDSTLLVPLEIVSRLDEPDMEPGCVNLDVGPVSFEVNRDNLERALAPFKGIE